MRKKGDVLDPISTLPEGIYVDYSLPCSDKILKKILFIRIVLDNMLLDDPKTTRFHFNEFVAVND